MSKKQKKEAFQKYSGLLIGSQVPLVLIRDEIDAHIHHILLQIIDGIAAIGIQMAIVAPLDPSRRIAWEQCSKKHPKWITIIDCDQAKSDVFDIAVAEDMTIDQWKTICAQRMVPLAEKGVSTFDPIAEKGNGFLFHENPWSLFAALVRAQETYRFPYDWENLIKSVARSAA